MRAVRFRCLLDRLTVATMPSFERFESPTFDHLLVTAADVADRHLPSLLRATELFLGPRRRFLLRFVRRDSSDVPISYVSYTCGLSLNFLLPSSLNITA